MTDSLLAFALVAGLITITPGADTVLVLSAAMRGGASRGLPRPQGRSPGSTAGAWPPPPA